MFVRVLQSFIEPVPASGPRTNTYLHSAAGQVRSDRSILLGRIKRVMNITRVIMQLTPSRLDIRVLLERSPLVTGLAVTFLFVQNREVLEPLADDVSCASLGEFFEDSANGEPLCAFRENNI